MQVVIFDFGNVVGFFDHNKTLERLVAHTHLKPRQIFEAIYWGDLEDQLEAGRLTVPEFLAIFRERCHLRCEDDYLHAAIADIFTPNPAVVSLVPRLAGRYRVLLGSNTNAIHAGHFQQQFADTLKHFTSLVLSWEIGARKPDAAFYAECLRRAQCPPEQCVFVDDLICNVEAARASGMKGILYHPRVDLPKELAALGITV